MIKKLFEFVAGSLFFACLFGFVGWALFFAPAWMR